MKSLCAGDRARFVLALFGFASLIAAWPAAVLALSPIPDPSTDTFVLISGTLCEEATSPPGQFPPCQPSYSTALEGQRIRISSTR
jgi:hypothetical protein